MFFIVSKVFWAVAQPSSLVLIALAWGLWRLKRGATRAGIRWLTFATLFYLVGGVSPLGHLLTLPLENRFVRPDPSALADIAGLIVLGGSQDTLVATERGVVALTDAAERLTDAATLLPSLPGKPLLFSGSSGQLVFEGLSEAELARRFFSGLGIDPARLWLEDRSRNTYQNAVFSAELLQARGQAQGRWLLVTSAYHMPRAVGCFRQAGIDVLAFPVDYRTRGWSDLWRPFPRPSDGLRRLDEMTREWIGLIAYRATGRSSALLPSP